MLAIRNMHNVEVELMDLSKPASDKGVRKVSGRTL